MGVRAVIILVVGGGGAILALWRPYVGMLLVVFLYFWRPSTWGAEAYIKPVEWVTIGTLVGWLVHDRRKGVLGGAGWLILLPALYLLSTSLAPYANAQSWDSLWQILKVFVFAYLMFRLCDTPKRLSQCCLVILAGCLWMIKAVLVTWAAQGFSGNVRVDTAVAQGGGANYIAWVLATTLPLLMYKAVRAIGWQRWAAIALIPLWLTAIVATGSRGGLLCTAASVAVCLVLLKQIKVLAVTTGMAVALALAAPAQYWERTSTITTDPQQMDSSALARYQNIFVGLRIIKDYPLFGTGLDTFPEVKRKYVGQDYVGGNLVAHNTYLQMASELGLPFLAVFVLFNLWLVRRLLFVPKEVTLDRSDDLEWVRIGMLGAIAATAVQMVKGDMAKQDYFWWVYGIAIASQRLAPGFRPSRATASPSRGGHGVCRPCPGRDSATDMMPLHTVTQTQRPTRPGDPT